ncbi:MAG: hypothetical protein ACE5KH_01490 [Candidatus Geothermarchaeales archaeon]
MRSSLEDIVDAVTVKLDERLSNLTKDQLLELVATASGGKKGEQLVSLLSDYVHFSALEIVKASVALGGGLLQTLLGEPEETTPLRKAMVEWLENQGYNVFFDVKRPRDGRRRPIDVVGLLTDEVLSAVLLCRAEGREVEEAFSRAAGHEPFSHYSYVALSPYSYVANVDRVKIDIEKHPNVGALVADRQKVICRLRAASRVDPDAEDLGRLVSMLEETKKKEGLSVSLP